jgi:UTP--glucose-1-phosphate uridylyltransferase
MKGVILAAGQGVRMSSVTYDAYAKELLPIGSIPAIRFPLEALKTAGLKKILVVIDGKTKNGIVAGLGSGHRFGLNIGYIAQEKTDDFTGIGAAIYSASPWIEKDEDIVVACGDTVLCDFSKTNPFACIQPLVRVHKYMQPIATVVVYPTKLDPTRYGVVKFNRILTYDDFLYGELNEMIEKPSLDVAKTFRSNGYYYVLTGYYAFKPKIFSYIKRTKPGAGGEMQITDAMKLALSEGERIYAVIHGNSGKDGIIPCHYWDMGVPEDYKEANKYLFDYDLNGMLK